MIYGTLGMRSLFKNDDFFPGALRKKEMREEAVVLPAGDKSRDRKWRDRKDIEIEKI
jgi:hypothetical protein